MNLARLSDALDATDPLLETERCPRQLEIDYQAAALMKIQALAGGIGGEEQSCRTARESAQVLSTLG